MRMPKLPTMNEVGKFSLAMASPPDNIDLVHRLLDNIWVQVPTISMIDRISFETALIELVANVIRHADGGEGVTYTITIKIHEDTIEAEIVDTGIHARVELHENSMPDDLSENGRGIPLIKTLVDHISYDRANNLNTWLIRRKFRS